MATCNNPGAALVFGHRMPASLAQLKAYRPEIEAGLAFIPVRWRTAPGGPLKAGSLQLQRRLADNVRAVMADIASHPEVAFVNGGTYCFRGMNNGSADPPASVHSLGLAVDVNPAWNPYARDGLRDDAYRMRTDAHPIVRAFKSRGWAWGGDWSRPDYMHFEFSTGRGPVSGDPARPPAGLPAPAPDFRRAAAWARANCAAESMHKCAGYAKRALQAAGMEYAPGDGFRNQEFCERNGYVRVSDFRPLGGNPRPTAARPIQWGAPGYSPRMGDVCLIEHPSSGPGHMAWFAGGPDPLNGWVSDFWQRPPGQQAGCGPYCYAAGITRVQIWRHSSMLDGPAGGFPGGPGMAFRDRIAAALGSARLPSAAPEMPDPADIAPDGPSGWPGGAGPGAS